MCPVQLGTKGNSLQNLLKVTSLQHTTSTEGGHYPKDTRPWLQFSYPQSQGLLVGGGFSLALLTFLVPRVGFRTHGDELG